LAKFIHLFELPSEPHNKYILFNREANRLEAFANPDVAGSVYLKRSNLSKSWYL